MDTNPHHISQQHVEAMKRHFAKVRFAPPSQQSQQTLVWFQGRWLTVGELLALAENNDVGTPPPNGDSKTQ